jgi:hypothetical protein
MHGCMMIISLSAGRPVMSDTQMYVAAAALVLLHTVLWCTKKPNGLVRIN